MKRTALTALVAGFVALPGLVARAANAPADKDNPAATKAADDEIEKNLDELRASLERLGHTLGDKVDGDAHTASAWLTQRVDKLSKALDDANKKANDKGGNAEQKAREGVASALKNLSQALDRAAGLVEENGKTQAAP